MRIVGAEAKRNIKVWIVTFFKKVSDVKEVCIFLSSQHETRVGNALDFETTRSFEPLHDYVENTKREVNC